MTKILAVWYPVSYSPGKRQVVSVENDSEIKNVFGDLLFDKGANNLLVNYGGKLYIIESTDRIKRLYNRRVTQYHPLSGIVNS